MTREEAKEALSTAIATIGVAAEIIRSQEALIRQYLGEAERMDSVGPIIDPTLFNSSERRATDALLRPIFQGASDFLRIYDERVASGKAALVTVTR